MSNENISVEELKQLTTQIIKDKLKGTTDKDGTLRVTFGTFLVNDILRRFYS